MATIQQINANRRNAQLSTGPRTEEGKQRAAANALQSGIYAESEVLFTEDPAALEILKAEYHDRFQPTTPEARDLVDSLIRSAWLLRRLAAAEASLFNRPADEDTPENLNDRISLRMANSLNRLDLLQRRINSTERNYHRSLKVLTALPHQPDTPEPVEAALQPLDSKTTSEKLASFPQTDSLRDNSAPPPLRVEYDSPPSQTPNPRV